MFFFIVPDVYIGFATLFSVRAGALAWVSSIAGSAAGVFAIWILSTLSGFDYLGFLPAVPGISERLVERVGRALAAGGLPWTPLLIFSGVPLKLYAALAFSIGAPLGSVLLWTVFARIVRIAPTFAAAAAVRAAFSGSIEARPAVWTALLAFLWASFYVFYFVRMSRI